MKTYLCVICYKEFSHSDSLKNHAKLHYPLNKKFICPKCSAACLTEKDLQSHILQQHIEFNLAERIFSS